MLEPDRLKVTDNTAHGSLCMLDTYRLTLIILKTECFCTTTVVMRTRLNAVIHANCLSC